MSDTVKKCALADDEIRRLRAEGLTHAAIGALAGVSKQRIHQIVMRAPGGSLPTIEPPPPANPLPATAEADPTTSLQAYKPLLSARAWNALNRWGDGDWTVADIRQLGSEILCAPSMGLVGYREICALFGMPFQPPTRGVRGRPRAPAKRAPWPAKRPTYRTTGTQHEKPR